LGAGFEAQQLLVKSLGSPHWEHRQVDHRGSPILAVGQGKLNPQTANNIRPVDNIGLPAPQREAAYHRDTPGAKYSALERRTPFAVTLEEPVDVHALGMVPTEAGVDTIDLLKNPSANPRGRQFIGTQPTAEIGKSLRRLPQGRSQFKARPEKSGERCREAASGRVAVG